MYWDAKSESNNTYKYCRIAHSCNRPFTIGPSDPPGPAPGALRRSVRVRARRVPSVPPPSIFTSLKGGEGGGGALTVFYIRYRNI